MARDIWSPVILFFCGLQIKVKGGTGIQKDVPYIFISNHHSYLDIPVLFRSIRHDIYFVAKKELKWFPFIGWYMQATGMIFVDRNNIKNSKKDLSKAAILIQKGKSIFLFPEGKRSRDASIGAFKNGSFFLASEAQVSIVPIHIKGTHRAWGVDSFQITPTKVEVNIGEPFHPSNGDVITLNAITYNKVIELSYQ
ncbi:MAG: lysophospholipid acyltransferase family protein [Chitinophagaceae bacterium]|nr:lysophospholipid acyltransferase family protein [Chitinophagaceae bacterium]